MSPSGSSFYKYDEQSTGELHSFIVPCDDCYPGDFSPSLHSYFSIHAGVAEMRAVCLPHCRPVFAHAEPTIAVLSPIRQPRNCCLSIEPTD
mmetsp:Transcript_12061/g.20452  ORF Transcript_12061/g.20452 Transcript_12061/m.20452 type:complete len:91 (-) Transcript_12061:26-298(-)